MILTFCNQKGGVGKSTSLYHLARAAVASGRRVLVVDADPQGNTTEALTVDVPSDAAGVADALSDASTDTLRDVLVEGVWDGLTVAPTVGEALNAVRDEIANSHRPGWESRLRRQLEGLKEEYDLVLIDSGPALDTLSTNAFTASDGVLIVTQSTKWSLDGLALLLRTVAEVRRYYNPTLEVAGIVLNQHEALTSGGKHYAGELEAAAAENSLRLLTPYIPKRAPIKDAVDFSRGLDEGDYKARPLGKLYSALLEQIMEGTGR